MAIHSFVEYNEAMADYVDSKVSLNPKEITVDYSNIISIADAFPKAAKDVRLKVEAIQDLHGYNNPWVGGAGKNKFNINSIVSATRGTITLANNGVTLTSTGADAYTNQSDAIPVSEGETLTVSWDTTGSTSGAEGVVLLFNNNNNVVKSVQAGTGGYTYTVPSGITSVKIRFGVTASGKTICYNNIMIRKSGDATYEPYENICPISGWTEAKPTIVGDNLFNGTYDEFVYCPIPKNTQFTASIDASASGVYFGVYDKYKNEIDYWILSNTTPDGNRKYRVITLTKDVYYVKFYSVQGSNYAVKLGDDKVFSPYATTYTIDLGGTRYGGTLDVTSGVLTLDRNIVDISTINWSYDSTYNFFYYLANAGAQITIKNNSEFMSSHYAYGGYATDSEMANVATGIYSHGAYVYIKDTRYSDAATFKTAMSGAQLVYELATPQTIQLTAEEVQLLLGYNTLFGDTGDISLTYNPATYGNIVEEVGELEEQNQALTNEVRGNWATGGVNLFNGKFSVGYNISNEGDIVSNSKCAYTTDFIAVTGNKVTVSFNKALYRVYVVEYDATDNFIRRNTSNTNISTFTATLSDNCKKIRVAFNYDDSATVTNEIANSVNTQVELGDTATPYQPYAKTNVELTQEIAVSELTGYTATAGSGVTIRAIDKYRSGNTVSLMVYFDVTDDLANNAVVVSFDKNLPKPVTLYVLGMCKSLGGDVGQLQMHRNTLNQIKAWGVIKAGSYYCAPITYLTSD